MASKKELVEGQAFSRRRLVTAFVSGAPGGREVEPGKPLRAVVGGVVLSAVLVVGALAAGLLSPTLADGWDNNSLVIAKDTGARYVALNGTLYPVINTSSARLLIPSGFKVVSADADKLTGSKRGTTVGIIGAPDALPDPSALLGSGWTSCTSRDRGVASHISRTTTATAVADRAVIAQVDTGTSTATYLVDNGYRYQIRPDLVDGVTRALALDAAPTYRVTAAWINLFSPGAQIAPFAVPGLGQSLAGVQGLPGDAVVGSVVTTAGDRSRPYLLESGGRIAPLTAFAATIYQSGLGGQPPASITLDQPEFTKLAPGDDLAPATWPGVVPEPVDRTPCAMLRAGHNGTAPTVALGTSSGDAPRDATAVTTVDPGAGALVRGIGAASLDSGPVFLVDQTGVAFPVEGSGNDNPIARLGYSDSDIVPVPATWTDLLASGPTLSVAAANTPVTSSAGG